MISLFSASYIFLLLDFLRAIKKENVTQVNLKKAGKVIKRKNVSNTHNQGRIKRKLKF